MSKFEMTISKNVADKFLITSEGLIKLLRTGETNINLKDDIGFTLKVSDNEEDYHSDYKGDY